MWARYTFNDFRICLHYLGVLVIGTSLLMVPPILTALFFGEWEPFRRYLTACIGAFLTGSVMRLSYIGKSGLTRNQAMAITALGWIIISFIASFPIYYAGHHLNYMDAFFDCVSATTTSGASLIVDLDHLSNADNMMRFMLTFAGGLGLIVVALSLGLFGRSATTTLFTSEGRSEHVLPNVVNATRYILRIALIIIAILTTILFVMMLLDGLSPARSCLHAFWMSISCFITGGLTPMQQSVMYYNSTTIEFVCMVAMLLGAISFSMYYWVFKGKTIFFFEDIEIKTGVILILTMTAIFTLSITQMSWMDELPTLLHRGVFTIISCFTTTGLSLLTTQQLISGYTSGAFMILAIIMAIGGCSGSTAGGIKFDRVGIIAKSLALSVKQAISPQTARITSHYHHAGKHPLDNATVKNAMTVFVLYIITYALGSLAGIAHGYDAQLSIFESIALTSNGGLSAGIVSPGMPVALEIIYMLLMWGGRLEFITLLGFIVQIVASFRPRRRALARKES